MEKKKYKVMGDTKNTFLNIDLELVIEDDAIGTIINVLGGSFKITQNITCHISASFFRCIL